MNKENLQKQIEEMKTKLADMEAELNKPEVVINYWQPKDVKARAVFINYIKGLRGLASDKMIIIHCSDYYGDWVEYSVIGDNLGHNSRSGIKRLYKKDII